MAKHNDIALEVARQGIVLLKNDGVLPLAADEPMRIAVIGGQAELGVPTGTGSSAVTPPGGYAAVMKIGGPGVLRNLNLLPSSPVAALRTLLPKAQIEYDPGQSPAEAALLAQRSDVVIAFGIRIEGEGYDLADLTLPWGQDAVIDAVASVNPNTIVVLDDRQSGRHALARQGEGNRRGMVSRPSRRAGDRRGADRHSEPIGAPPDHVSG